MTFNEHGAAMASQLDEQIDSAGRSEAGRDLALSRTHLEDALTRYNSAQYRRRGTWNRLDPDKAALDNTTPKSGGNEVAGTPGQRAYGIAVRTLAEIAETASETGLRLQAAATLVSHLGDG